MTNFAADDWISDPMEPSLALAAMETQIETVDNAKTIACGLLPVGADMARAWVMSYS